MRNHAEADVYHKYCITGHIPWMAYWLQGRMLHHFECKRDLFRPCLLLQASQQKILSFLISTRSYLAVARRNFLPSYIFLLAIDTKCKYWQWSLSFEISCTSLWSLEAITSTNWIRKQRNPKYVVACLWYRPESKKVDTRRKRESKCT